MKGPSFTMFGRNIALSLTLLFLLVIARYCSCEDVLIHKRNANDSIIQLSFSSRSFQYRGVALGGWLVLEPYITPSLFLEFNKTGGNESDIPVDEYHYCKTLGSKAAKKRLEEHWSTFYNESDFALIKQYGLNMVRIPIGYWAFEKMEGDPYVQGAQEYLDKAIEWAHKYDLKVWVDLHGVPGSQNGFDNSGYRDIGYPGWLNKTENVDLTYKVLHQIYSKYGGHNITSEYYDTIVGIEVINEPFSPKLPISDIKDYYNKAYEDGRKTQVINNTIVFHDAFKPIGYWNDFLSSYKNGTNTTDIYNILIDHHHYEVFSAGGLNQTIDQHIKSIKDLSSDIEKEIPHHPAVVGEWLAALTDCTPWLNGVGLGSRYEGQAPYDNPKIGSCKDINNWSKWSKKDKVNTRKFIEIQLDQYESKMNGWIFWCFKTEDTIEWDFKRLVELGLMPQPLTQRKYIVNGTDTNTSSKNGSPVATLNNWTILISSLLAMFI